MGQNKKQNDVAPAVSPTLQRNALRKIFDRQIFMPEEVARLGSSRLQQAEGIGQKGLATIITWLSEFGYELRQVTNFVGPGGKNSPKKIKRNLEFALRTLRTNGYVVYRRHNEMSGDQEISAKTS